MLDAIARRLFGSANDRYVRGLDKIVEEINALEAAIEPLSDADLAARTPWLKKRLEDGESLDDILADAFATVREAARRTLGERHYDVQLVGGIVLHRGMIAEMKTGEGKTLCSTLAVYLNALTGGGVHIVTVNDYLAKRDAEWMGKIYTMLGMTVGCVVPGLSDEERRQSYMGDITYGTNSEFGFDYLRDNMKFSLEEMVQRPFQYAIVDEVDSILIDEARTPLIISGASEDSSELYDDVDKIIPGLIEEDYEKDEKARTITLTDEGNEHVEVLLNEAELLNEGGLYDISNINLVHHVNQALRAHKMFERDTDYIVHEGQVVIIDEFTGRMMEGRRYSEGLHQALEAKEGVEVENENQTLASITYQNYFRMYPKLAGMTGTAMTEAGEFAEIYKLEVVDIPTNVPCIRDDQDDEVYRSAAEKHSAILEVVGDCQERGQPVLVGTVSIEKSEAISDLLKAKKIKHQVLNARYHEQEALIIAQAGAPGSVTIATNMAGRGTDIQMGGNIDMLTRQQMDAEADESKHADIETRLKKEVAEGRIKAVAAGGLMVIGTERHESRRVDNQLRGRSGRQGDPGDSKFFLSLEDDLMRIFGSERMDGMLSRLGLDEGEAIIHPWVNKALEKAQQKVEARNFDIRKNLLKFDDVMNDQRKVIYEQRRDLMDADDVSETIQDMRENTIDKMVGKCMPEKAYTEQWDINLLHEELLRIFGLDLPVQDWAKEEGVADAEVHERIADAAARKMAEKAATWTPDVMRDVEKSLLLQVLDQIWKDHLLGLDHLRQGIGLRAYAQRDPLNEYKGEAFEMFNAMLEELDERITLILAHIQLQIDGLDGMDLFARSDQPTMEVYEDPAFSNGGSGDLIDDSDYGNAVAPVVSRQSAETLDPEDPTTWGKVGRNSACPCGSGKKYKHCHGIH
ncbi:MAG: preprotein translocase subunit SecA [Rhodospirillaceae bacterium]|nr:preprotein translocase subunit SecA [Rhodospirillaceae bacterium]MBT3883992.1 preprotein translocase subunit SecA [Rhodospirillaceae bacterium]MBT4671779.1 preprotein translocase subunit SecA [Rhodospirillaceae bacterium]MBT4719454.1 preprotein translocase subunit SecA [Rhodospirillaceae bacterium]MBT4750812.1 preprotein translocase subunit SecA [Rhodospirillaceae bacterium]